MKKFISIGFSALLIMNVLVVLDIVPVTIVSATGDPYDNWNGVMGDDIWGTDGDWVVDSFSPATTYSNITIVVNGNLTITDMYTLTLRNVTLLMNCTNNGTFNITVQSGPFSGGLLIIEDLDGDPLTTEDASNITSYTPDGNHRFGFIVEDINGAIQMRNSELHQCGWDFFETDYRDGGLWIGGYATIENNEISDNFAGIILYGSGVIDPTITGNNIHDNPDAPGIYLFNISSPFTTINIGPGNTVRDCFWGVFIRSCTNINIHNNTLYSNGYPGASGGLSVDNGGGRTSADIWIQDNNITANVEYSLNMLGWFGDKVNDVHIYRNEINGSTNYTSFEYVDGLEIRNNYICQGGPNSTLPYIRAWWVTNGIFDNNIVSNNMGIGALFNTCEVNITNNSVENNPGGGLGLQYGSSGLVENNKINNNKDMGLHIVGNNIDIRNNEIKNNGDGDPYMGIPMWQDCGLDVLNSYDIRIYNNLIKDNVRTLATGHVDGIYLLGTERENQVYLWNNTMEGNNHNIHARGWSKAVVTNSTRGPFAPSPPNPYEVYLEDAYLEDSEPFPYGPNYVTYLNVTFDNSSVYIADSISGNFTCQWYKNIKAIDFGGSPISGASIWINDSIGNPEPSSGQPFITDSNGWVKLAPLTEYVQNYSSKTFYTPHTIEVIEGSRGGFDQAFMWHTHDNILMLEEGPNATALRTEFGPTGSVYRTNTIIIEAEGDDIEDTDDILLTPHFEYRVNITSPWVDESSSYFGPKSYTPIGGGEGVWEIEFTPPTTAPIDTYGFRVRFNDTTPSYGDWLVVNDMVDVLNNLPNAEDILVLTVPPDVYRGNNIDIFANASDIEDISEDATWNAELEYWLNGSSSWESIFISSSGYDLASGNWKFVFSPPASSPDPRHGPVDLRVRFQDPDGNWSTWYQENDLINILNNPPQFVDLFLHKDASSVYRGNTVRVYANVSDAEEFEQDLYVHFYYSEDGIIWVDSWLSTPSVGPGGQGEWDPVDQRFFVEFLPPTTANLSNYQFRLYISDSDGGYLTCVPVNNIIEVKNNPPIAMYPVSVSAPQVLLGGGYVYIYVDAQDAENAENQLTLRVQQRFNDTAFPPDIWFDTYITIESYEGTPPTGRLRANFTPLPGAQAGFYDFRAWVVDEDGNKSNYVYLFHAVEVLDLGPVLENITLGAFEVYRNNTLYIFLNASDIADDEWEMTPEVQYKAPNGSWTDIPFTQMSYDAIGGCWIIAFTPNVTAELGTYEFRGRVKNTTGAYSNGGAWAPTPNTAQVRNNLPLASNLRIEGANIVYRGGTIYIFADGIDIETNSDLLIPHFEYREEGGIWEDTYLLNLTYDPINDTWRINFSPPPDISFTIGLYDFRVWFEDEDGGVSNIIQIDDMVQVSNAVPIVDNLTIPSTGHRLQTIYITANGTDAEHDEVSLTPIFEYKGPTGDWTGLGDPGSYLQGVPTYINGYWLIEFYTPADAELGQYSFRVQFFDGENTSDWKYENDSFTLLNNPPSVIDLTVPSSAYTLETIYISANGSDPESNESALTPIFQYKGPTGGWTGLGDPGSYLQNPAQYINDYWRIDFRASGNAELGLYSFRVQFSDGVDTGQWMTLLDCFTLMSKVLRVDDLNVPSSCYRTQSIQITANGTDPNGSEADLIPEFEYKGPTGDWISQGYPGGYFTGPHQYTNGYWQIGFNPPEDAELGLYSFRIRFTNATNTTEWMTKLDSFTLMNNPPTVSYIFIPSSGYRLESFYITSNGIDIDGNSEDLTPIFQYKGPTGDWIGYGDIGSYFQNPAEYVDGAWRIEFNPSADAELGQYSFRVQYSDDYDTGEWMSKLDSFTLMNIAPEVEDLNVPSSGYRLETIYITANGTDGDGTEHALIPNFQYRGPNDADWISQGDSGSYLTGTPQYVSGYWKIEFSPPAEADLGLYSFRVQFSDGIHTSQWTIMLDSFTLMNNLPTVQITSPSQGVQSTSNITFLSLFSDVEDSILTFEWDFGDGSPISNEISPTHNYTMNGTYIVTITVQDSDGGTAENSITIIIPKEVLPEEPGPDEEGPGFDAMLLLLILLPIIVAILIIILLLAMRKKREEPPTIPPEEITSMEAPEEALKEPTGIAEVPPPPPPPPPPEDVSEPPLQEEVQDETTPVNESLETQKSESKEEIDKQ